MNITKAAGQPWQYLRDPRAGVNRTPVYLKLCAPTPEVADVAGALRHIGRLPRPIRLRLVSAPGESVQFEVCSNPLIVVGRSPHQLGKAAEETREILQVLAAQGLNAEPPDA